jgi:3',5'-cyclic AMP phosphodiesterase CpdA
MSWNKLIIYLVLLLGVGYIPAQEKQTTSAPPCIIDPSTKGLQMRQEKPGFGLQFDQLSPKSIVGGDSSGLIIDLADTSLFGEIYSGPFYFERFNTEYYYSRFRHQTHLEKGQGLIPIKRFLENRDESNVNLWTNEGVMAYRLNLYKRMKDKIQIMGLSDSNIRFLYRDGIFRKGLTITEGPIVNLITSDHPDWMIISFDTDEPAQASVVLANGGFFRSSQISTHHEIRLEKLQQDRSYKYHLEAICGKDTLKSPIFHFHTAPERGVADFNFIYTGDGRAAYGGGESDYLGVNRYILQQIGYHAFQYDARFLLFNGDLVSGYTTFLNDLFLEYKAFKQSLFGLMAQTPVYCAIGNHEALLNVFDDSSRYGLGMDKWPYGTSSAEAFFAKEFVQPQNGPESYDFFPPYKENVYSFSYGNVKIIVFNNNYWWTSEKAIAEYGGSPEGYILPNQMDWIRKEITQAENDPLIKNVFLMGHEPVFPNGGHVEDAMWYNGDNRVRAAIAENSRNVKSLDKGIIQIRNEFWEIVSNSTKVVAVLGSDEHAYHRTLITDQTPVGVLPKDDLNGNGILDDGQYSANPKFKRPLWNIVCGGAGAPYYTQEKTPWTDWVHIYSSHYNYLLFTVSETTVGMKVYDITGELLDQLDDLRDTSHP